MSEVYKGEHVELGRMVAVKVLHPFLADEEGFVVRFKREARMVATLRQHNIVQVYDFDYNDELGIYYMVMEYIDGPTLKERLNDGPLPVEEAAKIGIAISEALDYAHERGMVHRDVKPANIMFIPEGEPVLTDFGIAKMLSLSELTASGAMVGTPAYMAPEVGIGKAGTSAADIYSMGVVLYQMATGRLPFESDSPMGIVMKHINDPPPPLTDFNPSIPPAYEAVVLRALEKQPEMRFEHAADMADALRRVLREQTSDGQEAVISPSPPVSITAPSATERFVTEDVFDDDDRLLRTWPPTNEVTPTPGAPTHTPMPVVREDTPEDNVKRRRRTHMQRVARVVMSIAVVGIVTLLVWTGLKGNIPTALQQLLALAEPRPAGPEIPVADATVTPVPGPLATATDGPTAVPVTVTPTPASTPYTPDSTAVVCVPRVKLNQVRIEPDEVVAPGTKFIAYISLRNNGDCAWLQGLRLAFDTGERMTAEDSFPIASLGPGETIQLVLPMQAPPDVGTHASTWTVQQVAGTVLGIPIVVQIEVGDVPAPTPTPPESGSTSVPVAPLTLEPPELVEWDEDVARSLWYGTIALQATGGVGSYRYYKGEIRNDTLLPDGQFTFEWQRCAPLPVAVWVVSGEEVVSWEGVVDYPAPENCR